MLAGGLAAVRRIGAALGALLVAGAVAIVVGAGGRGAPVYRVDAIFDNADFLVAGQDVKIAGAVVGQVSGVHLTRDRHARIEMEIEQGFAPFRSDASCTIRPQSLIGEKFVDCDPGSPKGRVLASSAGSAPTVPLARNHSPVDLDLVFAALRLPYRQRLALLVNELGTGLAGRPQDLNAAIRRANPALQQANRVLAILDRDRNVLGRLIDASDTVIAELARRHGEVASFIGRADTVARAVADRRGDLALAIHRLPPLLDQLQPSATELAGLVTEARPVARDLRSAAGPVQQLLGDLDPLTQAARPTLVKLNELSVTGRRALGATAPVARKLLPVARLLPPVAAVARRLNESLRSTGAVEGLQGFVYFATVATARFDRFSHILPSYQIAGSCQQYATTPTAGCSAHWAGGPLGGTPAGVLGKRAARRTGSRAAARKRRAAARRAHRRPHASLPAALPASGQPAAPASPSAPAPSVSDVQNLLDYLLAP